jgi:hypothetical protein
MGKVETTKVLSVLQTSKVFENLGGFDGQSFPMCVWLRVRGGGQGGFFPLGKHGYL